MKSFGPKELPQADRVISEEGIGRYKGKKKSSAKKKGKPEEQHGQATEDDVPPLINGTE